MYKSIIRDLNKQLTRLFELLADFFKEKLYTNLQIGQTEHDAEALNYNLTLKKVRKKTPSNSISQQAGMMVCFCMNDVEISVFSLNNLQQTGILSLNSYCS